MVGTLPDLNGRYHANRRDLEAGCRGSERHDGTAAAARKVLDPAHKRTAGYPLACHPQDHIRFALALRLLSLCLKYHFFFKVTSFYHRGTINKLDVVPP